jgi:hypothetical protein
MKNLEKLTAKNLCSEFTEIPDFSKINLLIKPISELLWEWEKEVRKADIIFIWNLGNLFLPEEFICLNLRFKEVRKEISLYGEDFLKILNQKDFKKHFPELDQDDKLKNSSGF